MTLTGDEAARLAEAEGLDYAALGFLCGLEIHQQLDTRKLFSPCPSEVVDPDAVAARTMARYERVLKATRSELGETDVAALAESRRARRFRYLAIEGTTSLVELDEEPPHPLDPEALDVALTLAGLLGARPAAEVHVMRKIVIDGSNTSGFQRTALVATGGAVDVAAEEGGPVGTWTLALEEDSARKLEEKEGRVTYTLDRLGIPLIEVATAPTIQDPQHAQRTAARIGALLRATGRVKRGLGTIRQDLNVSIAVGGRVEIKGCQDLRAVPRVIEGEVRRQLWLHHVAESLRRRGFDPGSLQEPVDVSDHFAGTPAKIVARALAGNGRVLALVLPKWNGLIAGGFHGGPRMGREFVDHARVAAGVKGVFHSDELPAYGITPAEVDGIRHGLAIAPEDAFVLCVERPATARRALEAVAARAAAAMGPAPKEVRAAQPDDSTRYMRPLPGAARMYPETDVPPVRIAKDRWDGVLARLPKRPEERVQDVQARHGLSRDLAVQLVQEGEDADLDRLVAEGAEPGLAARTLLQYLPGLAHAERVRTRLSEVFTALREGGFAKEALPELFARLDEAPERPLAEAVAAAGLEAADAGAVEDVVRRVVEERAGFVRERGMGAIGPLMGPVMAELRGKADGKLVSERLRAAIEDVLAG